MRCAIIIPVYNESRSVHATLAALRTGIAQIPEVKFQIYCVDDGSTDDSATVLRREPDVKLISHSVNRGYGAALKTGIRNSDEEWIFIVDADSTYPIDQIGNLLRELGEHTQMVIGAREGIGITMGPFRRLARWLLRKLVHALTGVMVPDLNSGMRVFRRSLYAEFQHLLPMGFSFTTTITVASLYQGYDIKFFPIPYDKRVGHSNIKPVQDFFGFVMLIVRLASYFDPLRFFLPISVFFFLLSAARIIRDIIVVNSIGELAVILMFLGIQSFFFGIIADLINKRSISPSIAAYEDQDSGKQG